MHKRQNRPEIEPAAFDSEGACAYLQCGHTWLRDRERAGELKSVKRGRKKLYPKSELDRFLREAVA